MSTPVRTILVVDDEPHVVHVVRFKLEQAGFTVLTATNGREGFDLACREQPALVVTDFQMPGGSGLEMATRLRQYEPTSQMPLVMLTARGHRAPLDEISRTNIRALLAKPFSPRDLLRRVSEILEEPNAATPSGDSAGAAAA